METIFDARSWSLVWQHRGTFVNGFLNTLESAAVGLLIALAIGIVLGLAGISEKKPLKILSRVYVEFFQNTPLILQVCFLYYALVYAGIKIPVVSVGFIALGIYTGAYMAEVIRAGILSIPAGQFDAAISQGFSWVDMMRIIILPQTIKRVIPAIGNEVITLVKDTSLAFTIAVTEMFTIAKQLSSSNTTMTPLVAAGVFYYVFNFIVAWTMERIEKHYSYYN